MGQVFYYSKGDFYEVTGPDPTAKKEGGLLTAIKRRLAHLFRKN